MINIIYYLNIKNIDKYEGENKTPGPWRQKSQILVRKTLLILLGGSLCSQQIKTPEAATSRRSATGSQERRPQCSAP
jgi:hypothetical protein